MNTVIYKLLSKTNEERNLDDSLLENLYQYYDAKSIDLDYEKNISKDDFNKIFNTVYDVLRLRINDEEAIDAMANYLSLLIADARDGFNVDINWCIKYIWYLGAGLKERKQKYKDCISFIQQKLLKEFSIKETIDEKVKRKVFTSYMTNI